MKWEYLREEEFGPAIKSSGGVCVMAVIPPFGCTETIGQAMVKMSVDRLAEIFEYFKTYDDVVTTMHELNEEQ